MFPFRFKIIEADNEIFPHRTSLKVSVLHHDPFQMSDPAHPLFSRAMRMEDCREHEDKLTPIPKTR